MTLIQIDKGMCKIHPYQKLHVVCETSILIETKQGIISIMGNHLSIYALDENEIWMKGEIKQVTFS